MIEPLEKLVVGQPSHLVFTLEPERAMVNWVLLKQPRISRGPPIAVHEAAYRDVSQPGCANYE
jgi:hypothetical protein